MLTLFFSFFCFSYCVGFHVCSLKPAAFVFTEPCMSSFLFFIIFTLILCRQADVFDGVTWGQIWVPFHCICPVFDVISWSSSSLTSTSASPGSANSEHYWVKKKQAVCNVILNGNQLHMLSSPQSSAMGWQQFVLSSVPLVLLLHFSC